MDDELKQLTMDVMTNFIESGYSQWPLVQDYTRCYPDDDDIGWIDQLIISSTDDDLNPQWKIIGPDEIANAMIRISLGATNVNSSLERIIAESLTAKEYIDLDAETDDCIVQIAVFGELVYG